MMRSYSRYAWLLFALAVACATSIESFADTLLMDNGDRLSGRITRVDKGKITVATDYAGEVNVDVGKIRSLESDQLMTYSVDKKQHIYGSLSADNGRLRLHPEDGGEPVDVVFDVHRFVVPGRVTGREWKFTGHANIGGSDVRGNTVTSRARVDAEMVAQRENFRVIAGTTVNHATDHHQETESNVLLHAKYDRFITLKHYGYGNTTLEHDRFKDIRLRSTVGAGRGYDVFASPQTNLSVEGGLSFVHTDFYSTSEDNYPALRLAARFDRYLIPRRLQLFHTSEIFVGLDGLRKSFAHTKTGLRLPLRANLMASLEYDVDWDGNPSPGNQTTDRTVVFSLGYHW
jgi:putative salt-induced outer membrane protein YdiY